MIIELINRAIEKVKSIYGDLVDDKIIQRIKDEIEEIDRAGKLCFIGELEGIINERTSEGTLILPRLALGNLFLFYVLGISIVNPLPRHHYCPKCHTFHWGNKTSELCEVCGEPYIEDGYDLNYELFIDDIKRSKHPFQFSTSGKNEEREGFFRFYEVKELKYLKDLGIKQSDLYWTPDNVIEVVNCFEETYYSSKYKKKQIAYHPAFSGIMDLGNRKIQIEVDSRNVKSFDELVNVVTMMHGTGVRAGNYKFNVDIYSRDDMYKFLLNSQISRADAYMICRETRLCGNGHLSSLSESKLKEAGVGDNYIEFMRSLSYIFMRGHVVAELKMLLKLAKIYLEEPKRFYEVYFSINRESLIKLGDTTDLIKVFIKSKNTELEQICMEFIDKVERTEE